MDKHLEQCDRCAEVADMLAKADRAMGKDYSKLRENLADFYQEGECGKYRRVCLPLLRFAPKKEE